MRCRSWVIITPPKRDDPIYASERFTVFLPQSGFVQRLITTVALCYIRSPCGRSPLDADMETHVEFRSDRFPPLEGEENLINPDLWGKRLADFLREGLARQGFETKEPIAEDW